MKQVGELIVEGSNAEGDKVWDRVCGMLDSHLRDCGLDDSSWHAEVVNFGWQKLNGHKDFHSDTAADFISTLLPETDCAFKIYKWGENGIAIQNWHHDSNTGDEWYYIKPIKD